MDKVISCLAEVIRKTSKDGRLVTLDELESATINFLDQASDLADSHFETEVLVAHVVAANDDINEVHSPNGTVLYYSSQEMTANYAAIVSRKGDPSLLADIVRENSEIYPRPVPLDLFKQSPFGLSEEEILAYLGQMSQNSDYQDIAQTITSIGTVFLYSSLSLEPDYANVLAEWIDVGASNNP